MRPASLRVELAIPGGAARNDARRTETTQFYGRRRRLDTARTTSKSPAAARGDSPEAAAALHPKLSLVVDG
jgi:hypothetical protein